MAVLTEDMKRVVRDQGLGFVATVCPDGTPNLSPKGLMFVWDDEHLIFADLASPTTMANLARNPVAAVNVVDPVLRKGYRFKGRASLHTEGPVFEQALRFFEQARTPNPRAVPIRGVAIVAVDHAAALISPAYAGGATEQDMIERSARRLEQIHGWDIARHDRPGRHG
jgi:predicted pyridoxine 5'-phosphate oxidase superfamily flavin-nucleotide-binding protein